MQAYRHCHFCAGEVNHQRFHILVLRHDLDELERDPSLQHCHERSPLD